MRLSTLLCANFLKANGWPVILVLGAALMLTHHASFAQNASSIVVGRVIDEHGMAVEGADVFLEPENYALGGIDRFIESFVTPKDGKFRIERDTAWIRQVGRLQLFVSMDETNTTSVRIGPPFDLLRRFDPSFRGLPIDFSKGKFIDVGDVVVRFRSGEVHLDFSRIRIAKTSSFFSDLFIRVRHASGACVDEKSLSLEAIKKDLDRRNLKLSIGLPTGRWMLEFVTRNRIVAATRYFLIKPGRKAEITVQPAAKTRPCVWPSATE